MTEYRFCEPKFKDYAFPKTQIQKKQDNICYSFQADQLMFALHFVRGMHPELFQENVSGRKGENYLKSCIGIW